MYKIAPITDRVGKMREKYRNAKPELCTSRYRLITEFYINNPSMIGILKRAKNFKNICENIAIRIDEDEVIVGAQSSKYRGSALYPENSVAWLKEELENDLLTKRDIDPYIVSDEDRKYILSTVDFWMSECMSAKMDAQMINKYYPLASNGVTLFNTKGNAAMPVGHFSTGYDAAIRKGFAAIRDDAEQKMTELVEQGMPGTTIEQYHFYRAVSIVCDGMISLTKRYSRLAAEKAATEADPGRKKELETMAGVLDWCIEKPCRTFHEAIQCLFMYQTCLCLDANLHGISFGRVDQYLGDFYENDVKAGRITPEYAQELLDLFYLKVAEMNKAWSYFMTMAGPGYTSGQLMTLGGVGRGGEDATNAVTYMMLQTAGRLVLHDPPQALRIHRSTPPELWEAAVETTKIAGGVPSFENDDIIIPALQARGLSLEDSRDYALIGCVEPAGCGTEWPACGGTGSSAFMNLANVLLIGINDGYNPMPNPMAVQMENGSVRKASEQRVGLPTGYLYDMQSFEEVKEAYKIQIEFFVKWQHININSFEYVAREVLPNPVVSATMEGCMKKGKDVMWGGAKYNSTGSAGVGIGNVADSLNVIRHCIFEKKVCSARELHDALTGNWEGYEDLRRYILNEVPHFGNGIPEIDELADWAAQVFADAVLATSGPRGNRSAAGLYPVTVNVWFGMMTAATPDGRMRGEPLADGIAAPQGYDRNGPTALISSVARINQSSFSNGTLMNLKFHPTALQGEEGWKKLTQLMQTYFDMGGMELQINVISIDTLKDAQKNPEKHKDLVVRVAGFSAYFVELHITGQNDLIRRTELNL